MEQPDMLPIVYCQYHACWCPGDLSHKGISRHGIDQISQIISSLTSEELSNVTAARLKISLQMSCRELSTWQGKNIVVSTLDYR